MINSEEPASSPSPSRKEEEDSLFSRVVRRAIAKFKARPIAHLMIPVIAALVGWFTNYLAVQMIFYPVGFVGIPLYRIPEVPLGFVGWQGIVPCKTKQMSESMVHMVTTQLLSVKDVFAKLKPSKCADILAPEVPKLAQSILEEILQTHKGNFLLTAMSGLPSAVVSGFSESSKLILNQFNKSFLRDLTIAMQNNIDKIFSAKHCVVDQMMRDRSLLGKLFRKCGQKELDFLTNSGLWFGFLLGIIQLLVALVWDNPWSLSIGGGIVGLATNWLALKWIFEPVNPLRIGPIVLQGMFLKRQPEVAVEFSKFFANKVLTSKKMWHSMLVERPTPEFKALFEGEFLKFVKKVTNGLGVVPEPEVLRMTAEKALAKLPEHLHNLHGYADQTFELESTLRTSMEKMTSAQFERVLHPIFEEDELTLIVAGAALGFVAGLIQQGLETGQLKFPTLKELGPSLKELGRNILSRIRMGSLKLWQQLFSNGNNNNNNNDGNAQGGENTPPRAQSQ